MTRRGWILIGGGIALLLAVLATQIRVSVPSRPSGDIDDLAKLRERGDLNVVFLLIDTLRADRLSAYGYARPTSPTLADIAASGVRFSRVEAQSSWTKSSMASLWTGLFTHRTGVVRFPHGLPDSALMPAEIFQNAGYVTAGLYRNGWVGPNFGFAQGFDLYVQPTPRRDPEGFRRPKPGARTLAGTDEDITQAAIEFLNQHQTEKFLLYAHYMDSHQYAYDDVAASLAFGASLSDTYDASIHWVDSNLYALLAELDRLDLLKKTLVVIAADHGEAFREHGGEGHAANLYQEVVAVPLLFMLPFRLGQELTVEPVVRNVDIWPTILDLTGLPPLPQADGVSLVPLMEAVAKQQAIETPMSMAYLDQNWGLVEKEDAPLISLRNDGHRVLFRPMRPEASEIYDLEKDPGERRNLRGTPPEWAAPLETELKARLADPVPWGKATEVNIDDMQKLQLRALGYVVPPGPPR